MSWPYGKTINTLHRINFMTTPFKRVITHLIITACILAPTAASCMLSSSPLSRRISGGKHGIAYSPDSITALDQLSPIPEKPSPLPSFANPAATNQAVAKGYGEHGAMVDRPTSPRQVPSPRKVVLSATAAIFEPKKIPAPSPYKEHRRTYSKCACGCKEEWNRIYVLGIKKGWIMFTDPAICPKKKSGKKAIMDQEIKEILLKDTPEHVYCLAIAFNEGWLKGYEAAETFASYKS